MIQDIGEHRFDLSFRQPEARDEDYVLYMKSNKTLLRKAEDGNYEIPRFSDFPMEKVRLKMKAYICLPSTERGIIMCGKCSREKRTGMNSVLPRCSGK